MDCGHSPKHDSSLFSLGLALGFPQDAWLVSFALHPINYFQFEAIHCRHILSREKYPQEHQGILKIIVHVSLARIRVKLVRSTMPKPQLTAKWP